MLVSVIKEVMYSEKLKNQYTLPCIAAAIVTLGSVIIIQRRQSEIEDDGIATVPYILPLFGSTLLHNRNGLKFAKETAEKYGPVYRAHLFGKIVTVVGAGHAEEVFTHPNMSFNASQEKKFKASHFFVDSPFELRKNSIQDSIVKELTPKLKQYSPRAYLEFEKVMNTMLGRQDSIILKDLGQLVVSCISNSCLSIFLGPDACNNPSLSISFLKMFQDISGEFKLNIWHQVFPWYHEKYMKWRYPSLGDMKKNRASIKAAVEKELERRLESDTDEDDLLQYIIKTHSMKNTASSVESLTTYIQIMFFVGVLTTVGSTIALIQVVANDPSLIKQLREEQEKAIDDEIESQQPQNDDMDRNAFLVKNAAHIYRRLAKLDSLLREGFRYGARSVTHPHTNIGSEDIVLKSGAIIKPGEEVYVNLWDVHRQTKVETDQMEDFEPFRFVDRQAPSTKVGGDFLLFGMGKHACPGRWFAIHQMKGVITCLIRNYEITALKYGGIELTKRCPGNVKLDIV